MAALDRFHCSVLSRTSKSTQKLINRKFELEVINGSQKYSETTLYISQLQSQ